MAGRRVLWVLAVASIFIGAAPASAALRVHGNRLTDRGHGLRLLGVNRSGTEYACLDGHGEYFDGPSSAHSIHVIRSWRANTVRLPLNESCWLGRVAHTGRAYRRAVVRYVRRLRSQHLYVVLDSHLAAAGRHGTAQQILPMLDARQGVPFWRSVARTFRHARGVAFDLYNEPHDVSWRCWARGCTVPAGTITDDDGASLSYPAYRSVGMSGLARVVRRTGARGPILVGGVDWGLDLSAWLKYRPRSRGVAASVHTYGPASDQDAARCLASCRSVLENVARHVPVVTGELGEYDCAHAYIDDYMRWADAHGISYLGWTWDAIAPGSWQCGSGPALIEDYEGTPSPFGVGLRDHLRGRPSSASAARSEPRLHRVRSWAFAIGNGALSGDYLRRLAPFDLVVVDGAEARRSQIRALRARGKIVLGYLDVGAIERTRSWYRAAKPYRMELWDDWGEWYADTARAGYRRLIARRVAPRITRKRFDGLFLDNVDMVSDHPRQARGMRRLVAALGRLVHRRGGLLFAQNGEEVIGPMLRYLDGWNREDVTRTWSFARHRYVPVGQADHQAALRALSRMAAHGLLVTATDYVARGDTQATQQSIAAACGAGALPYVSSIGLDRVPQVAARC